ncbi:hypothetical type I restriction-modification system specificity determinant [Photobacterium profundum SS9]|uniref:Hypothetical type I restriction-modification system specificity determinant n=2 Tax=Photobacterium profundum TaxID=74109 RepID=Q6LTT0_PHOPR|nr:restriction endonuclease subunit S [Photobacterium profundum]CAG19295.1 hypothetical type I restriction-modification system specificity determinant [Photobacterium profundum SS9]
MSSVAMMPKYEAYNESGVEWIGNIPEHWNITKAKYLFNEVDERSVTGHEELLSVSHITGVTPRSEKNVSMFMAEDYSGSKTCQADDIVFNTMWAWMGALGVSERSGIVSPSYGVFRQKFTNTFNAKYLEYLLKTPKYIEHYNKVSTGLHSSRLRFYGHMFFDMKMGYPHIDEQNGIIKFLDNKTNKIDEAAAIKEKQISLLKERKQIIIQQAVTRGLNPDVPMRDSGVDWIGEIPDHWCSEPIKYSLKGIIDCEHKTAPFVDKKEFFVVRTSNVKQGKLVIEDAKYTNEYGYKEWTSRGVPFPGDILLTREAPAGEACLVPDDRKLCLGQRMVWLKVDRTRLLPEFALSLIYSSVVRTYIDFLSAGSTVLHFNMADIKNIPVILPPINEQAILVTHIKKHSDKIDKAIELEQQQISKLKEYKSILINSAVTGKIKVV